MPTTTLKPIYALVGDDALLQTEALRDILKRLPPDAQRIDIDGERAGLADVLDEARSFAMFGGTKVVVVADAGEFISRFREAMESYCAQPSDSAVLVLRADSLPSNQRIHKIIQKTGQIVPCVPPKERDLPGWIASRARHHKLALTSQATLMLADLLGSDLGRIDNELAKLALQCPSGNVDVKDIQGSVAFQREQEMWHLTDEIGAGNTTAALRRWRQLVQMDTSAEFRAVTWLGMWLERSIRAIQMLAEGTPPRQIGYDLKIFPAEKVSGFLATAQRLGSDGLYRALTLLVEIDRQSKSGVGDAAENVERFILAVGNWLKGAR